MIKDFQGEKSFLTLLNGWAVCDAYQKGRQAAGSGELWPVYEQLFDTFSRASNIRPPP